MNFYFQREEQLAYFLPSNEFPVVVELLLLLATALMIQFLVSSVLSLLVLAGNVNRTDKRSRLGRIRARGEKNKISLADGLACEMEASKISLIELTT